MALVAYRRVQARFPDFADAWINASAVLNDMGRAEESLEMATHALELAPENPIAICALATALQTLGRLDEAAANFQKSLQYDPNHAPALTNLAGIYNRSGDFAGALALDDRAVQLNPSHSVLRANRGHTKMRALDLAGAEEDLSKALELDANNAQARWNLAYVQLLQHRYQEAWPNFRARRHLAEWADNSRAFGKPHWGGEPLNGRTLLIYSEQGFGDTLHFARFIPQLGPFGGHVLLSASRPLMRLLSNIPGIDGIVAEGAPLPPFDLVAPLMELPVILNADSTKLSPLPPPSLPDCQPAPELCRQGFKVGLAWAGSPIHTNDALRSMSPRCLDCLADIPGIAWYGLQLPPAPEPPKLPGFTDLSHRMGAFLDTAQLIKQLDLVVTVDTSLAHVAGFLGLPAIILLAYLPDWRWGINEPHSPWYPSLALLRQPAHGDWQEVARLLKERIAQLAAPKT
jgi:Flp pilus assembly protein TadD